MKLIEPCGNVDVTKMKADGEDFTINFGMPLIHLPATKYVMLKFQCVGLAIVLLIVALLMARLHKCDGIGKAWGDVEDVLVGGFPKIEDNESLLSQAEIIADDERKKKLSGPDFIAPVNYYRIMAMLIIANPHDISYMLWIQSSFKVFIVLAAQVCIPLYELQVAITRVSQVEIVNITSLNIFTFVALLTVVVWMNKVMITKVDDALGANIYLLDKYYVEPTVVSPPATKPSLLPVQTRIMVKHFWCTVSFALKIMMSFVINAIALLAVAEFHGTSQDFQGLFVTIGTLYVLVDLDMNAVVADGHMCERYRVYVCRLVDQPPETPGNSRELSETKPMLGSSSDPAKAPSYWYVKVDAMYKAIMRAASLMAPVVLLVIKFSMKSSEEA